MLSDLSQYRIDLLYPELALVLSGLLVLIAGVFVNEKIKRPLCSLIAVLGICLSLCLCLSIKGIEAQSFYGAIMIEDFSIFFKIIILIGALIAALLSYDYLKTGDIKIPEYFSLMLFAASGMTLLVSSADLISILISIEIMSLSMYILVGIRDNEPFAAEATLKYFILGSFSSAIMFYGITLVYGASESFLLSKIAEAFSSGTLHEMRFFVIGMGMIIAGIAFKVASVPFHMWAPDVYQGAPAPITGYMAVGVKAAAFAAALRIFVTGFEGMEIEWKTVMWWLAVLSILAGNLMALMQENIKRMLAYSGIAHAGYILIGLATATPESYSGMLFYLAVYVVMNIGAFGVIVGLSHNDKELEELKDWSGIAHKHPFMAVAMTIFLLSLAGIPPMGGFFAKFYLFYTAVAAGDIPLVIIAVMGSCISLYYYLKVIILMYMKEPLPAASPVIASFPVKAGVLISSILVVYLGILPSYVLNWAKISIEGFIN